MEVYFGIGNIHVLFLWSWLNCHKGQIFSWLHELPSKCGDNKQHYFGGYAYARMRIITRLVQDEEEKRSMDAWWWVHSKEEMILLS